MYTSHHAAGIGEACDFGNGAGADARIVGARWGVTGKDSTDDMLGSMGEGAIMMTTKIGVERVEAVADVRGMGEESGFGEGDEEEVREAGILETLRCLLIRILGAVMSVWIRKGLVRMIKLVLGMLVRRRIVRGARRIHERSGSVGICTVESRQMISVHEDPMHFINTSSVQRLSLV